MNHRMHPQTMGYLPSPMPGSIMLSNLRLNVTVYFTPELPFTPPTLTRQPQKVVDMLKIMVVMTPDKSVRHLKQQITNTISIVSKDENLPLGSLNIASIRNSQNYVAHNDMILGHAFNHDENIYAIVLSNNGRPWQYMASPLSERRPAMQRDSHNNRILNTSTANRNTATNQRYGIVERNERIRNVSSNQNVTTSEESEVSDDTYESSFVEKEDRQGYLDLEAEESDGSVSSMHSPSPAFKGPLTSSFNKQVSLKELKRRRKNVIQVSESEEEDFPPEFKSHSHYVASLIDKAQSKTDKDSDMNDKESVSTKSKGLKEYNGLDEKASIAKDDKEVDERIVLKDMENNQFPEMDSIKQSDSKAVISSDESSESSEEEMREAVKQNETSEIARDIESDSESSSSSGSGNDSGEEEDEKQPINQVKESETVKTSKTLETNHSISESEGSSESDETENDQEMTSKTTKGSTKATTPSSKRKYSSLSEIASNASNHSSSSKVENQKKMSSSSSPSSSDSSSESNENKGKRVKRSSLRSLSKEVSKQSSGKPKKSVAVKPKPIKTTKKKTDKAPPAEKSKPGKPINTLLDGSSEFQSPSRPSSDEG